MDKPSLADTKQLLIESLKLTDVTPDEIGDDDLLFGDGPGGRGLGLDSIDALSLVVAIKKRYGVEVPNTAESRAIFTSVRTLTEYLGSAEGGVD